MKEPTQWKDRLRSILKEKDLISSDRDWKFSAISKLIEEELQDAYMEGYSDSKRDYDELK